MYPDLSCTMLSRIASAVRVSASRRARAPLSQARFLSSTADESLEDFVARAMGDAGFSDEDAAEVTASLVRQRATSFLTYSNSN